MEHIDETEQWLLNGDCSKCRRKNYCSKECTRYKRRTEAELHSLMANKLNEMTGGVYGEVMNHLKKRY